MSLTLGFWCPIHSGGFERREQLDAQDLTFEEARDVSLYAERLGFEYALIAARWYGPVLECWTTTAALASITTRLRLIVAVHSGLVQPQIVAKMGANIDQISHGRFHVNLVSSSDHHEFQQRMYGGPWFEHDERYALSDEYIRIVKGLWTQNPYSYDGQYYQLADVDLRPKPVQRPYPPIFLGGQSPPARELVAKECEWYFVGGSTLERALELKADIEARAARHGRQVRFALSGYFLCRDSNAEAQREVDRLEALAADDRSARTHVLGLQLGMWGTAERIADRLAEFGRLGFEMALLQARPMLEEFHRFGAEVVPLLPLRPSGEANERAGQLIAVA